MYMQDKNVIEKFNEFWMKLNYREQKDLFLLLSATRGPDLYGFQDVKEITTGKIRNLLFKGSIPAFCNTCQPAQMDLVVLKERMSKDKYLHFRNHILDAYFILEKLGYLDE